MIRTNFICCALIFTVFTSCGTSSDKKSVGQRSELNETQADRSNEIDLISAVYRNFVFATDSADALSPDNYFTGNALKKLQADYEFDCAEGTCYAFYALRTTMQDSKPGTDEASRIIDIEPANDGWYIVSYSDMGWPGKTKVKITDGKIDDYTR